MEKEVDVLVVGLGPAGANVINNLAKNRHFHKITVMGIDKRKNPGYPVQCAEFVPTPKEMEILMPDVENVKEVFTFPEKYISQRTSNITFVSPKGKGIKTEFEAYTINRGKWNNDLVLEAEQLGVTILRSTKVIDYFPAERIVKIRDKKGVVSSIKAKVIVGADGANSLIAKKSGLWEERSDYHFVLCKEYYVEGLSKNPDYDPLNVFMVFGEQYSPGAYAWIIPKGKDSANVGCGIRRPMLKDGMNLSRSLENLFNKHPICGKILKDSKRVITIGGVVPVGIPFAQTVEPNYGTILIGDSCCQVVSNVGGGIPPSIVAGKAAAEAIIDHLINNEPLTKYEEKWRPQMEKMFKKSYSIRRVFDRVAAGSDSRLDWYMNLLNGNDVSKILHQRNPWKFALGKPFIGLMNLIIR